MAERTLDYTPPRIMPLPRNAITSFQVVNIGMLAWWTYQLLAHYEQYDQIEALQVLPSALWWGVIAAIGVIINGLPLVPWWARWVNHAFWSKLLGLFGSIFWWGYLTGIFLYLVGLDNYMTGLHFILMLGAIFEFSRLMRWGRA